MLETANIELVEDYIAIALVVYVWYRIMPVILHANGKRPFLYFYMVTALILLIGSMRGLAVTENSIFYPTFRIALLLGMIHTFEWSCYGSPFPWRWSVFHGCKEWLAGLGTRYQRPRR